MLYGANGHTGQLITHEATKRGMRPLLAGRRAAAVGQVAQRFDCAHRIFSLDSVDEIARQLDDVDAVLLCAGPFSRTSGAVVEACLRTRTHYLDITGEIAVFEAIFARDQEARERGVVLLPGVGFDVVPSDCLAKSLHQQMPDAERLTLAFHTASAPSPGTMKTSVEAMGKGGAVRRGGRIVQVPTAFRSATIPFRDGHRKAMTIPWGDVSTAYHSTGICEIEVYMAMPTPMLAAAKLSRPFTKWLGSERVRSFFETRIDARNKSASVHPDQGDEPEARSQLWGRVDSGTAFLEATLVTPGGYRLTAMTSVESVSRILQGALHGDIRRGAFTPSRAFGADFIQFFSGCNLEFGTPA